MTEQHVDIESIFDRAVEIDALESRQAYLDEACGGDKQLRRRVEALLRASNDAGSFLEKPPEGLAATIAGAADDTVDKELNAASLGFLAPSDKPGCVGTLAQYEVVDIVGRGGMGIVLRAYDTKLNRVVAIKVMAPELAANRMAVKRFLREARAAAAVSHDHVVTIHAIEEDYRPPFIVMEFVDGQSLQEKIDRTGGLELDEILRIGMQMARGLSAAHEQGLVHRDIKPANILLENGVERVKLTDFGLARAVDDVSVTQTGQIAGTPQFMSPEQAQGHTLDARSDLFSLGSVLYTMCTGRPPFRAETPLAMLRRVTDDDPRSICEVNADIPEWLEAIVFKLLAKDPAERFRSATKVAELLSQHLAHLQHPTTAPQPPRVGYKRAEQRLFDLDEELGFIETTLRIYAWIALMWAVPAIVFAVLANVIPSNFTATSFRLDAPGELVTGVLSLGTSFLSFMGLSQVRRRDSYGKAMAGNVAALLPVNPFLVFVVPWSICSIIKLRNPKVRTAFHPAKRLNRSWFNIEAAAAIFGLLILFAVAGILIYVRTDNGTIRVEVNDPNTTITIDDERGVSLQNADSGILTVRAGEHKLHVRQGELEFETDLFRVKRGEEVVVQVELVDGNLGARLITSQGERLDGGSEKHGDDEKVGAVAIRTREGFYLRAVDGGGSEIMADVKELGPTEAFEFEWQDDMRSRAWIRTSDGFYIRGILNRDGRLESTKRRGTSELFEVLWDRNQKTFRLRTHDGLYVHAPSGGGSFMDTIKSPGSSEVFTLVLLSTGFRGVREIAAPEPRQQGGNLPDEWPASETQESDTEFIQGTWNCLSAITSGKELPNEQSAGKSWAFAGETFFEPAIQRPRRGKFVLDTATDPKQIDLHIPAEQDGFVVIRGIYELKGDRLTICIQEDFTAVKRPTDFTTVAGDKRSLLVFQRATDQELLQGTWQVVALEGAGQTAPANSFSDRRFLFEGDLLSLTGMPEDLHTFRLNAASAPKQIDIGSGVEVQFSKAIYELEGDTLRLCLSQQTRLDRPKDFDTEGTRYFCFTLKRVEQ